MSRPKLLTSELVPLLAATLPVALSAMFAWSTRATMLASVSAGGVLVVVVVAVVVEEAAAVESARRAESALFSFLAHAATSAAAHRATVEARRISMCIGPPTGVCWALVRSRPPSAKNGLGCNNTLDCSVRQITGLS